MDRKKPDEKTVVVSFMNFKGGAGKTTSIATFAQILVRCGYKVLLIDLDPQRNTSSTFGCDLDNPSPYFSKMFYEELTVEQIMQTVNNEIDFDDLDIIQGNRGIHGFLDDIIGKLKENRLVKELRKMQPLSSDPDEQIKQIVEAYNTYNNEDPDEDRCLLSLRNNLAKLGDRYDYILIDTPPARNHFTTVALLASDKVVIPLTQDQYSKTGNMELRKWIMDVNSYYGTSTSLSGIFLTRVHPNTNLTQLLMAQNIKKYGDTFIGVGVRECNAISEANSLLKPILDYNPDCTAVQDYIQIAQLLGFVDAKDYNQYIVNMAAVKEEQKKAEKARRAEEKRAAKEAKKENAQ